MTAPRPDPHASKVVTQCYTQERTFSGGTATNGWATLAPPSSEGTWYMGSVFYGGDAMDASSSPTTTAYTGGSNESGIMAAVAAIPGVRARVEAAYLKVKATSAADDTAGFLQGAHMNHQLAYADSQYHTYLDATGAIIEERRTVAEGMTVRMPVTIASSTFKSLETTSAFLADAKRELWGHFPAIGFSGLAAATTLSFEYGMHISFILPERYVPFPQQIVPYDPHFDLAVQLVNAKEYVVSGNSFKSFFKKLGKGILSAANFVVKVAPAIASAVL